MKKIFSFLLLLALALCALAACTSEPGTESSKFEVPSDSTEPASEPDPEPASEPEESSAVVTEYYDEYGRFVELDEQGNLKRVTDYRDDGSVAVVDDYENGILVTKTWYDGERVDIVMEFAPNGNPTLRTEYAADGLLLSIDEYNDRGMIVKETIFYDSGMDWILYEYKDGVQSKKTTYRENGEIDDVTEFDENGFSVKYIEYIDGVVDSYEEYENDANGFAVRTNRYDPDGTFVSYLENAYDRDGNLVQESTYTPEGSLIHVFALLYDPNGQITAQSNYFYAEDGAFRYGTRVFLDENGNWVDASIDKADAYELYDSIVNGN